MPGGEHRIDSATKLAAIIGEPMEFVRAKVGSALNGAMRDFIAASPLVFVATLDERGDIDVSPKGDPAGFVQVDETGNLLIPERRGNRLTFGFHNILGNGRIGLIFVAPNQRETLRVKGMATLHSDPEVLAAMSVEGKPALMFTHVAVTECFFHCGKALIRSHLWQPDKWSAKTRPIAARHMAGPTAPDETGVVRTEAALEHSYREELY